MKVRKLAAVANMLWWGLMGAKGAFAHDNFTDIHALAGERQELALQVPHGCKGSPVKEVHVMIPDDVRGVSVYFSRDWKIETKMRRLPRPQTDMPGTMETIGEIIWSDPATPLPPSGRYENFKFTATLPDTPGRVLWFKSYQVCEQGEDHYADVPKQEFTTDMPDFTAKLDAFRKSAGGAAPYIILARPRPAP